MGGISEIKEEERTTGTTNYVGPYRYFVPFRGPSDYLDADYLFSRQSLLVRIAMITDGCDIPF